MAAINDCLWISASEEKQKMAHKKTLIPLDGDNLGMNLKLLRF
jgi:hypothetical protein